MWFPPKVRHLVLINQSPLPSSFPPRHLLPLTLLFPPHLHSVLPIFGEKPACSWDNSKLKTNSQLLSQTKGIFWGFIWEERHKKREHFWLLIVEECLSKLWPYQAQRGRGVVCSRGEGYILLEKLQGVIMGKASFTFCSDAPSPIQILPLADNPSAQADTVGNHSSLSGLYVLPI